MIWFWSIGAGCGILALILVLFHNHPIFFVSSRRWPRR